jgi:glycosyltransferase involved in cell wall biosynthesis
MQDYSNYHIVFIDDASEDETGRLMKEFAADHQISEEKLKIIINQNRTMAMPNLYKAAREYCKPYEIFMIVDGDD